MNANIAEQTEPPKIRIKLRLPIGNINKVAMALALPSPSGEACTQFTCFDKLPVELRLRVWRFAIFTPRDIVIGRSAKDHESLTYRNHVPAVLHVNVEARVEALKLYQPASFKQGLVPPFYASSTIRSSSLSPASFHINVTKEAPRIYLHPEIDRLAIMHQVSREGISRIDEFLSRYRIKRVAVDYELCEKELVPIRRWGISRAYAVREVGVFKGMVCSYEYDEDREKVGAEQPEERGKHLRLIDMDINSIYLQGNRVWDYGSDRDMSQMAQIKRNVEAEWQQILEASPIHAELHRTQRAEAGMEPSTEALPASVFKTLELVGRLCDYCSSPPASQKARSPSEKLPNKPIWYFPPSSPETESASSFSFIPRQ